MSPSWRWAKGWSARLPSRLRRSTSTKRPAIPISPIKPETGEELFHSFAGVPIIRREDAVGVLCVQHADPRRYEEVEIEALQTVAMVLSELIANAGLVDDAQQARQQECRRPAPNADRAETGRRAWRAAMRSITSRASPSNIPSPKIPKPSATASMPRSTRCASRSSGWRAEAEFGVEGEHREILEMYKMFAYDEGWRRRINEAIDQRPDRRSGDRARPAAHADADAPDRRSAACRPDARSGGYVEPADPHRVRASWDRRRKRACGRIRS